MFGALTLTSCGGGAATSTGPTGGTEDVGAVVDLVGQADIMVNVPDNAYIPRVIKVSPGAKVSFLNTGSNAHNVTASDDGVFDQLAIKPGATGSLVAPQNAGTYWFYCSIHGGRSSGQRGAIVVATRH